MELNQEGTQRYEALRVPTWALWALTFLGYVGLAVAVPLVGNAGRSFDLRDFTPSLFRGALYYMGLCLLYGLYWLLYRRIQAGGWRPTLGALIGLTLLVALPLLLVYPFNANDIYRYVIRGRITGVYGGDAFADPPSAFPAEPLLPLAGEWVDTTSPYGPVWELIAAAVARATYPGLIASLIAFKVVALGAHLLVGVFIWHTLPGEKRAERTLLWSLNPALLLIFVADGHNDSLMLLWLMGGWWLMRRPWPHAKALGALVMWLGPLSKPIALLALPYFFLGAWRDLPRGRARWEFALAAVVGGLSLTFAMFLPFGTPLALVRRLITESQEVVGFSPQALMLLVLQRQGIAYDFPLISRYVLVMFTAVAAWLAWGVWCGRSPFKGVADIFFAYTVQALSFRLWYTAWPFPFLLLEEGRGRLYVGIWFLLTAQLAIYFYSHVFFYWWERDIFKAHAVGVPVTFVLPFVLAGVGVFMAGRMAADR